MYKFPAFILLVILFVLSAFVSKSYAIYDPSSLPNNKIGIHILSPDELPKAAELVNSSGGDWGYVTIPIQAGDKNLIKWQQFMDDSKRLHLIPIIRLATEGDYFNNATWRKPVSADIVDFANFLNSLNWPVSNKYVILFNEVNRADEWEGRADPGEYAQILSYGVTVFKSKSQDFFVISSGMDNASETGSGTYNQFDFIQDMNEAVPGIFNQIDGISSHSYPNPGFSQPPTSATTRSISSFIFEKQAMEGLSNKKLPVFITETGWTQEIIPPATIGSYFKEAIATKWNDPSVMAVTPFLLKSGPGPFQKFSFLKENGDKSDIFTSYEQIQKTKGKPKVYLVKRVLGEKEPIDIPVKDFSDPNENREGKILKKFVRWLLISK